MNDVNDDGQLQFVIYVFLFFFFSGTQAKMEVEDLFADLADGIKLLKLLEIISGEKLGKPNSGRMRVHKIENLNKSLAFLHTKVSTTLSLIRGEFTISWKIYQSHDF